MAEPRGKAFPPPKIFKIFDFRCGFFVFYKKSGNFKMGDFFGCSEKIKLI